MGQNLFFPRLKKLEQKNPEKVARVAKQYSKIFKKSPIAYYFLSADQLEKFSNETDGKKRHKAMYQSIKYATLAQKYGEKRGFNKKEEWLAHRKKIKRTDYFYFQESDFSQKMARLEEKYYLFMSYGKNKFLTDDRLNIEFPADQKIDTLFYGLPTGNEFIKLMFKDEEQKMLKLINDERSNLSLCTMVIDSSLSAACRYHAYDMATQNYFDHIGYDLGKDGRVYFANRPFERIRQFYNQSRVLNDNNASERGIRNLKVKMKISNQFKSYTFAQHFAVIRSVIDTTIKNGQDVFNALSNLASQDLNPAE